MREQLLMNIPCRTSQHCAAHGWCHRCRPEYRALTSALTTAISAAGISDVSKASETYAHLAAVFAPDEPGQSTSHADTQGPLILTREEAVTFYTFLGRLIGEQPPAWVPPPPGDKRNQLPDDILAMLAPRMYLSTACEMAKACESARLRYPDRAPDLESWALRLHTEWCRLNNKYSGALCVCDCHGSAEASDSLRS
jgi:hypothetical protein